MKKRVLSLTRLLTHLLLVSTLIWAGCAYSKPTRISDHTRQESFRAYCDKTLGSQSLSAFLEHRTAIILNGMTLTGAKVDGQNAAIEFQGGPGSAFHSGHAAAIEADGYFVTAAHCADYPTNYLVYLEGSVARIAVPRLVAKVTDRAHRRDLAVLHIDAQLPEVFTWTGTDSVARGTAALSVGSSDLTVLDDTHASVGPTCLAGHITSARKLARGGMAVLSDLPARAGDSGAPLVDANGKLIGVHVGVWTSPLKHPRAIAFRPDETWISRVIKEDRLRSNHEPKLLLPPISKNGKNPVIMISLAGR